MPWKWLLSKLLITCQLPKFYPFCMISTVPTDQIRMMSPSMMNNHRVNSSKHTVSPLLFVRNFQGLSAILIGDLGKKNWENEPGVCIRGRGCSLVFFYPFVICFVFLMMRQHLTLISWIHENAFIMYNNSYLEWLNCANNFCFTTIRFYIIFYENKYFLVIITKYFSDYSLCSIWFHMSSIYPFCPTL